MSQLQLSSSVSSVSSLPQLAYKGTPVVTTETLAQAYEVKPINIQKNFSANSERFTEGKHYFIVTGQELNAFRLRLTESKSQISPKARALTLWTERGAARHAKMLNSDKAWDMFELLEETFFRVANQPRPADTATPSTVESRKPLEKLLRVWAARSGLHHAQCWTMLNSAFNLQSVTELPEAWIPDAIAWVQERLDKLNTPAPATASLPDKKQREQRSLPATVPADRPISAELARCAIEFETLALQVRELERLLNRVKLLTVPLREEAVKDLCRKSGITHVHLDAMCDELFVTAQRMAAELVPCARLGLHALQDLAEAQSR